MKNNFFLDFKFSQFLIFLEGVRMYQVKLVFSQIMSYLPKYEVDKSIGLKCDQTIVLIGFYPSIDYPDKLYRIKFYDIENDKTFVFLTNSFNLPALTIAELYKCRW